MKKLSEIEITEVEWLYEPYIPKGFITLLEGEPDVGKSWLTLDLAARFSHHGHVTLFAWEDDPSKVIKPRLVGMKPNFDNISVFDEDLDITVPSGHRALKRACEQSILVTIDPLSEIMGGVEVNNWSAVRPHLKHIRQIAQETNTPIIIVRHWGKDTTRSMKSRGMGSTDFTAIARSCCAVFIDEDTQEHIFAHVKHNLSRPGTPLAYRIDDGPDGPYVNWLGERPGLASKPSNKTDEAEIFLFEQLKDGPRTPSEVIEAWVSRGGSSHTLQRAKRRLGTIQSIAVGLGKWEWHLNHPEQ